MKSIILGLAAITLSTGAFAGECKVTTFAKAKSVLLSDKIKLTPTSSTLLDCIESAKSKIGSKYDVELENPFGAPAQVVTYEVKRSVFSFSESGVHTEGKVTLEN